MEFKGTRGEWTINPRASRNVRCRQVTVANCSQGQNGESEEEEKANAELIAEAGNIRQQINCSLSELLRQRNEMLEMLQMNVDILELTQMQFFDKYGFNVCDLFSKTKELVTKSTEITN